MPTRRFLLTRCAAILIAITITAGDSGGQAPVQVQEVSTRSGWTGFRLATQRTWTVNGASYVQVIRHGVTKRVCPGTGVSLARPTTWNVWKFIRLQASWGDSLPENAIITRLPDNVVAESHDDLDQGRQFSSGPPAWPDEHYDDERTFAPASPTSLATFPLCFSTFSCGVYDPASNYLGGDGYPPQLLTGCCPSPGIAASCPAGSAPPGSTIEEFVNGTFEVIHGPFDPNLSDSEFPFSTLRGAHTFITFNPQRRGLTLEEAAARYGYDHFNWYHEVVSDPLLDPMNRDVVMTDQATGLQTTVGEYVQRYGLTDKSGVIPVVPYHDPPKGGWAYDPLAFDDSPLWLEETTNVPGHVYSRERWEWDTDDDGSDDTLVFYDRPSGPPGFPIGFRTSLVGVRPDGTEEIISGTTVDWSYSPPDAGPNASRSTNRTILTTGGSVGALNLPGPEEFTEAELELLRRDGVVLRGRPSSENLPPTVDAGGPYIVAEGSSIVVSATGIDPEGEPLTFEWDLDGDGTFETPGETATFSTADRPAPNTYVIAVRVTDDSGLIATGASTVRVTYLFSGFDGGMANPPLVNEVLAGRAVAAKFNLNGDRGLAIFMPGYPSSQQILCDTTAIANPIEETIDTQWSQLTYKAQTAQYTYAWKTQQAWSGTCRRLILRLNDGSDHIAYFRFD